MAQVSLCQWFVWTLRQEEHAIDTIVAQLKCHTEALQNNKWKKRIVGKAKRKQSRNLVTKKTHTYHTKQKQKCVQKKRCSFTMPVHASKKKAASNMHTLPCKYHCDGLFLLHISRAAPSFAMYFIVFSIQTTYRPAPPFQSCTFFDVIVVRCCFCCCLWNAYFLFHFGGILNSFQHTQSSISCVLANEKDTTRARFLFTFVHNVVIKHIYNHTFCFSHRFSRTHKSGSSNLHSASIKEKKKQNKKIIGLLFEFNAKYFWWNELKCVELRVNIEFFVLLFLKRRFFIGFIMRWARTLNTLKQYFLFRSVKEVHKYRFSAS